MVECYFIVLGRLSLFSLSIRFISLGVILYFQKLLTYIPFKVIPQSFAIVTVYTDSPFFQVLL